MHGKSVHGVGGAGFAKGPRALRGYSRIMMRANAVALVLRQLSWLLLNMVPGARGFATAPVAPLKGSALARQHLCRLGSDPFILCTGRRHQGVRARRSRKVVVALEADSEEAASYSTTTAQDRVNNIDKARTYFIDNVRNATGPTLFRTWKAYAAQMPCREATGGLLELHACNYYVTEAGKNSLVSDMFRRSSSGRPGIMYAVQGSNRGKSACVFQAVLHAQRTRTVCIKYVHVAFHNNGGLMCKAKDCGLAVDSQGAVDKQRAMRQGHALAVAILKAGLYPSAVEGRERVFDLEDHPPSYEDCLKNASQLLRDAAGTGAVVWHLDEWLRVFETTLDVRGAAGVQHVRTGALDVLATAAKGLGNCEDAARTPRCTFAVTFIKPPDDTARSNIDRAFYGVPCVSERQYAAKKMPWLLDPGQCDLAGGEINDAATSKLCNKGLILLRDFLTDNDLGGLTALHTGEGELGPFETLINDALDTPGVEIPAGCAQYVPSGILAAVKQLADSCKELNQPTDLKYAAELLLAVDVEQASTNEEISKMLADTGTVGLQTLPGGRVSYEVRRLLEGQPIVIAGDEQSFVIRDIYSEGRDLYANQFVGDREIMSGTPLERAFLWVLSCESALTGRVFGEKFMCKEIKANRIFKGQKVGDGYDLSHLSPGVMYYCLEDTAKQWLDCPGSFFEVSETIGDDWPSHPRADVFYLTGSGGKGPGGSTGLTLVDITGASGTETKRKNLADWIKAERNVINAMYGQKTKPFGVRGVVLAPFDYKAETAVTRGGVDVVSGAKAYALLGGLQQAVGLSED